MGICSMSHLSTSTFVEIPSVCKRDCCFIGNFGNFGNYHPQPREDLGLEHLRQLVPAEVLRHKLNNFILLIFILHIFCARAKILKIKIS